MNSKALHKISYGLYVISSKKADRLNGQIANTVIQVTSEPANVAVCINKSNLTHEFIQDSKVFTTSILSKETPMALIGRFGFKSGRDIDKFEDTGYIVGKTGAPVVVDYALGYLEAEVVNSMDVGSHTIFVGRMVGTEILMDGEPMTYAYYHEVKRGKAPETAPTYIKEDKQDNLKAVGKMQKYECLVCGYVYDPEVGDPDSGIEPGTPFEGLPDDWVCPVCGADKSDFNQVA